MTRKDEIIYAALELASKYGLKAVSLGQIADRVGIKKPSLYNHFASKEEIVSEMYSVLREQAKKHSAVPEDHSTMLAGSSLEDILLSCVSGYIRLVADKDMLSFFKVLYSERCTSPAAAQILLEETKRMIAGTKALFYALVVHGRMRNESVDTAAMSFAMTVHALVDMKMDMLTAGAEASSAADVTDEIKEYIKWFSRQMEVKDDE